MMNTLIGMLKATLIDDISKATALRFKNVADFVTPEALLVYEQNILSDDILLDLCNREYQQSDKKDWGILRRTPRITYVPSDIVDYFYDYRAIVIDYDIEKNLVTLGVLPEFVDDKIIVDKYQTKKVLVPIYYYVSNYYKQYGEPDFLAKLPVVDLLHFIYREAISIRASDITITTTSRGA